MTKSESLQKMNWFTMPYLETQEAVVKAKSEDFFGKGRNGFCDFALAGVELMLQGIAHLRDVDQLDESGSFKGFRETFRYYANLQFYTTIFCLKAIYNLTITGYLTEASVLLRQVIETFVRLRYLERKGDIEFLHRAFAGSHGYKGAKFKVKYETQFNEIAPGLYESYRLLCGMAHGSTAAHILKSRVEEGQPNTISFDNGIIFKPEEMSFVINQYSAYLLAHLEFMMRVFPEIGRKMPQEYAERYEKTRDTLRKMMEEMAGKERNKEWMKSIAVLLKP